MLPSFMASSPLPLPQINVFPSTEKKKEASIMASRNWASLPLSSQASTIHLGHQSVSPSPPLSPLPSLHSFSRSVMRGEGEEGRERATRCHEPLMAVPATVNLVINSLSLSFSPVHVLHTEEKKKLRWFGASSTCGRENATHDGRIKKNVSPGFSFG